MSLLKTVKTRKFTAVVESFSSAQEVVDTSAKRDITDSEFHNMHDSNEIKRINRNGGTGVNSFAEAEELMRTGYQPTVDRMKKGIKANLQGQGKRFSFRNDVVGFQPIIPNAIMGLPNSIINGYMKPIKSKVLNIYYDMTASWTTSSEDIIKAGQKVLSAIMELEMQGYKFNLHAIQSYYDHSNKAYILCTKIKSANTPMDLKRISFPLTHTAYFRVIGWDWYSRCPQAKYIDGYGCGLGYRFSNEELTSCFEEIFKEKCVYFSASNIVRTDKDSIKEVLTSEI